MSPPRDTGATSALLIAAHGLVDAPDVDAAADILTDWVRAGGVTCPTPATFRDVAPPCPALQPVVARLLSRTGRAHSILVRNLEELDGQQRLRVTDFDVDDIPQLIWPCALTAVLRATRRPGQDMIRLVLSLALARIAGARTWAQAAQALGWSAGQGAQWTRYVFRGAHTDLRHHLISAALHLAPALAEQPDRHRWVPRPTTFGPTRRRLEQAQQPGCSQACDTDWCPCLHPDTPAPNPSRSL